MENIAATGVLELHAVFLKISKKLSTPQNVYNCFTV